MISKDMKYTALYWALRFTENELDVHTKKYGNYSVIIYADTQTVDYGDKIKTGFNGLTRHKDFVVLECVDRLLCKGYSPEQIRLYGNFDVEVTLKNGDKIGITCEQWGEDFSVAKASFAPSLNKYSVLYTSRLVSGLLEFKSVIICNGKTYHHGIFEIDARTNDYVLDEETKPIVENVADLSDFDISEDELIFYKGKSRVVKVPQGIKTIGASAFWNNVYVEEIFLPQSLERLGGDCFYYCKNLKKVNIPPKVWIMGNNPFAGCPNLTLSNESPYFTLENGVLYDRAKTNVIYFPIKDIRREFIVPSTVTCLGKHCFFACDNLERIIVPKSVIRFENNPFSGCTRLKLTSETTYYVVENGVIYNKFKTTIVGCLNGAQIDCLKIPESVTLISRNSFWNCKGVKKIIITKNVDRIGYNPFAGCENLLLASENDNFIVKDGIVYDKSFTHMLCATDRAVGEDFCVPDGITHINRGVFSGCKSLKKVDFNGVTYIDKSSFTNCVGLNDVYIPDGVTYIGEWAFSYCVNMKKISINRKTYVDKNAFNECPATIEWRD